MKYEVHVTVEKTNIDKFKLICKSIGLKRIVIHTQNGE